MSAPAPAPKRDNYFTPRGRLLRMITAVHRAMYRASGGRLGRRARGMPTLLLTTIGRRSGKRHTVPLPYLRDGDRMVVVGSFAASPTHPAWYLNLCTAPDVEVQDGARSFPVRAQTAQADERTRLWETLVGRYPWYADYQEQTEREIPLVVLTPTH